MINDISIKSNVDVLSQANFIIENNLKNKTWLALGDSISTTNEYQENIKLKYGILYKTNATCGMTLAYKKENSENAICKISSLSEDNLKKDFYTIFFGTNDWWQGVPLGSDKDILPSNKEDATTIYSSMNYICNFFSLNCPKAKIIFILPMQRLERFTLGTNTNNDSLQDFVSAMKERCEWWGYNYVDLFSCSGINHININTYTTDGLHPNSLGFEVIGRLIGSKMNSI